jgi:hypothetical protein
MMPSTAVAVMLTLLAFGAAMACTSPRPSPTPGVEVAPTAAVGIRPIGNPGSAGSPSPVVVAAASPSPGAADALVALAIADATQRTGAAASEVMVQRVEPREWPDRSLGCPKPGVGYAQVITAGYLIVVQVGGLQLEYHTDQSQIVACNG